MLSKYFCTLFLLFEIISGLPTNLIVETNGGRIQGEEDQSTWSQKPFAAFKGIPYAKAPVGELRFQPPEKHEGWTDVRESKYSSVCPQVNATNQDVIDGDEDCLYLNVFVPASASDSNEAKFPVLVFVHGGGFQYESGSEYAPNYWMEEDIIVVTFNYRLGILGFLQTTEGEIQGNMGLKDQVLLLKWVKDNIDYFGGDENQITLMGVSSGAASVHLHMLSELSQGLFHRAISQSGVALSPWAIVKGDRTPRIGKNSGCAKNTTEEYIACLKDLSAADIVKAQVKLAEWFIDPIVPVGPAIEKVHPGAFLTKSPFKAIREGKYKPIPWIIGVNSEEGLLHASDILKHPMLTHVIHFEWPVAAPITLILRGSSFDPDHTTKAIREFYFGDKKIGRNVSSSLINMYSDRYFFHGTHHSAILHSQKSPVYLYLFNYKGKGSEIMTYSISEGTVEEGGGIEAETFVEIGKGVAHYDQLQYLFKTPYFTEIVEPEHIEMAKKMRKTFTKFIKTGSVTNWVKVSKKAISGEKPLEYNILGTHPPEQIEEPWTERVAFWDSLSLMEMGQELDSIMETMNLDAPGKDEL